MAKEYTIEMNRRGSTKTVNGTMEYLKQYFGYTLECGRGYERERGNSKINMNPATGKSLVTALNNAAHNTARDGCPDTYYRLA